MREIDLLLPEESEPASEELHLIYKIEGDPNEVDVFELSRVLEGIGNVLKEGNRVVSGGIDTELLVTVKPFESGSFIMDLTLYVQQNPIYLAFLAHPEAIKQAKGVLEYIGLIKKVRDTGASLLELLGRLRSGKPEKVEKVGDAYEYHTQSGDIVPVSAPVNTLYNNSVINNYIFNIAAPAERPEVNSVQTYVRHAEELTGVRIGKEEAAAIRAYHEPIQLLTSPEVVDSTTTLMLNPKSGNYGETTGQWTFRIAGTKQSIKAKITDEAFLAKYTNGTIRFYAADLLKVRMHSEQRVEGSRVKAKNEIIEVLEYREAHPSERQ